MDALALREVERRAGRRFASVGLPSVAADEPLSATVLAAYARDDRSWVAVASDVVVGYVVVDVVDGCAHVEQVSVEPDHQGLGLGRALLDRAAEWGVSHDLPAMTLTTFADVPWNRPLYEHLGFRVLDPSCLTPGLVAVMAAEAAHGLDPALRVAMRRDLALPRDRG